MRRPLATILAAAVLGGTVLVASSAAFAGRSAAQEGTVSPGVSFAPTDQVIVRMRSGRVPDAAALGRDSGVLVTSVRNLAADTVVLKLPGVQSDAALRATVGALAKAPGVEWAEPDVRMSATVDRSSEQWDLGPVGPPVYGIDLAGAWNALPSNPAQVIVAVVDTGYVGHTDLAGQFVGGYDFVSDSRIGNDGDGRDNDPSDPGDWITNQESRRGFFRGCTTSDSSWHGTHVSGTIAALVNTEGINGINPNAKVLPVRVLGKCGGYTSDITEGVRWAAGLPVGGAPSNPNVAKVVNLSLGGGGACSGTWQSAIDDVTAAGTTVVVAAGNSGVDAGGYSPASCAGVITVASTGKAGNRAYYSNFGPSVEIAAPGGDKNADALDTILSTLNTGATSPVASPGGDTYVKYQGTSMAAPHVAGVASLMLAANPALTPVDIVEVMQQNATPFPSGSSCAGACGSGIVDAAEAVFAAINTTPTPTTTTTTTTTLPSTDAPGAFTKLGPADGATGIKKSVTLSWQSSNGASDYWVCIDTIPDGTCDAFTSGPYSGTSVRFVGLASRTTYEWQVRANNPSGSTIATDAPRTFSTR